MEYLNEQFPYRWIGRGDQQNWPTWSPDLTVLDFHVWGYMKNMVYQCKVNRGDKLLRFNFDVERRMNDLPLWFKSS
jgi:hypothetical protein